MSWNLRFRVSTIRNGGVQVRPITVSAESLDFQISTIACLYSAWILAGLECERLSAVLQRRHFKRSLTSFERACILVVTTDVLVGVASRHSSKTPLADTPRWLFSRIGRWVEDARLELPRAAQFLSSMSIDTDGEVRAKLQALTTSLLQAN
jgi:hypothetical protein